MHDKDYDIYEVVEKLVKELNTERQERKDDVERLEQELTLLRNEFETVKNEGCWLSKQNSTHKH